MKKDDKLLSFNIEAIEAAGYSVQTPVIITDISNYADVIVTDKQLVSTKDTLLVLK